MNEDGENCLFFFKHTWQWREPEINKKMAKNLGRFLRFGAFKTKLFFKIQKRTPSAEQNLSKKKQNFLENTFLNRILRILKVIFMARTHNKMLFKTRTVAFLNRKKKKVQLALR